MVSICIFDGVKVVILNRKTLKFEIDLDFVLIAITTSLKDYRICYLINKYLSFNFSKSKDLEVDILQGSGPVFFSLYQYHWEASETDFYFIANKGTDAYLIPEMRKADYFLMIKNYIDDDDLDKLITALNKIPEIVAAVKIDPKKIKSRENLLF
ncbi:MAG TPA: IPExxxVDY family protein [Mucilaginibacter sp.]|nr:IPExxxVDY family protein [Mucilaginibacter sp.]